MSDIMIVDDEIEIVGIVDEFLTMNGHNVMQATGGLQAIDMLDAGQKFDLMIIDRRMPEKDGIAVLKHLHSIVKGPPPPIIVMSGSFNVEETRKQLAEMGFDQIETLIKPVDLFDLLEIVNKLLL